MHTPYTAYKHRQNKKTEPRFLTIRRVNTLMAGAMKARSARGRYTAAGYTGDGAQKMYIASVPAGSAQDELLDYNRKGYAYRSDRPWRETPVPVFEGEAAQAAELPAHKQRVRRRIRQRSFLDRLVMQIRREKKDAALCALFLAVILTIGVASAQKMVERTAIQNQISDYRVRTVALSKDNESLMQQLEIAKSGERIRNLAQNELNILRPERAQTEMIYIQTIEDDDTTLQQNEEPRMEALDILLGLLNVFHIGE